MVATKRPLTESPADQGFVVEFVLNNCTKLFCLFCKCIFVLLLFALNRSTKRFYFYLLICLVWFTNQIFIVRHQYQLVSELKRLDETDSWPPCFGSSTRQCRHASWFQTEAQSKIRQDGQVASLTASILTQRTIYKAVTSLHLIGRKKTIPPSDPTVMDADWPVGSGSALCSGVFFASLSLSLSVSPSRRFAPALHHFSPKIPLINVQSRRGEQSGETLS